MKTVLKFLSLFSVVFTGLTTGRAVAACSPVVSKAISNSVNFTSSSAASVWNNATDLLTGSNPQQICVATCTTGTCAEYVVAINTSSCSFTSPTQVFSKIGGVTLVGSSFTNANLPGLIFQKFVSTTSVYCKGRIAFTLTTPVVNPEDPCAPCLSPFGQVSFSTSFDVFKNITTYPTLTFPLCVGPGEKFAITVDPKLQCAADGIGVDDISINTSGLANTYTGITLAYNSSDKTSFTYQVGSDFPACSTGSGATCVPYGPPNEVTFPLVATPSIGKCANYNPGIVQIYRKARNTWLTSQTFLGATSACGNALHETAPSGINNGVAIPVCTTANCQGTFILVSQGNRGVSGMEYRWTAPPGYELLDPATNAVIAPNSTTSNYSVKVRNLQGQQNSGTFSVIENNTGGGCNSVANQFKVYRTLTSGYNTVTLSPNNILCFKPEETFTATLSNPPGQTRFRWSVPTNWEITQAVGQNVVFSNSNTVAEGENVISITVKALAGAATGRVSVRNVLSAELLAVTGNSACEVQVQNNADIKAADELGLTHNFTYNATTTPKQLESSLNNTTLGASIGSGCIVDGLNFVYQFAGRVYNCNPTLPACTTAAYTTGGSGANFECNTNIFSSGLTCSQPGGRLYAALRSGYWYVGTFRLTVSPNGSQCSGLDCFYSQKTIVCNTNATAIAGRVAVDPNNMGPIYGGPPVVDDKLSFYPNPVEGESATVYVPKGREGNFRIITVSGKVLRTFSLEEGENTLDLSHIPAGIYRLQSVGNRAISRVSFVK